MHGYKYSKIKTNGYVKGQFIVDVPNWDGTQPQVEDPNDPTKMIGDPAIGIIDKFPVPGGYLNIFTPDTSTGVEDWSKGTWGEGDPNAATKRLEQKRDQAMQRINQGYAAELAPIHDQYPSIEREGWTEQINWARDHQAGKTVPELDAMATGLGITSDAMATKILTKRDIYAPTYAAATSKISKLRDDITTAFATRDGAALDAIQW